MLEFIMGKSTLSEVCFLVLEILAVLGFLLFAVTGICTTVNIGNIAGCFIMAAVFILSLKRRFWAQLIINMQDTQSGKVLLAAMGTLAAACILIAVIISVCMLINMNRLPEKPANIIVLGCRVKDDGPSLMLGKRIDAAYEYMTENEDVICIASGGKGSDEPVSEAEAIKNALVEKGISSDRIILEDKSENTFQNIRNSLAIMDEMGFERRAVIITSEFHQLRAAIIAHKQGLECYSKSSSTFLPLLPSYWIREWFGVIHEIVIGRS